VHSYILTPSRFLTVITVLFLLNFLAGCGDNSMAKNGQTVYQVQAETIHKILYFTGTFQPLRENTITNPMDGTIEAMNFHYGQKIKKGDVIFTLNSGDLQKQYNDTLTEYLKAKDNYSIAKSKFSGTEDLWQSGLLSKNSYLSEKSSLTSSRVTLMQASQKLYEILEKIGDTTHPKLSSLSFEEFDKVRQALTSKHNLIHLRALEDGVFLYPPKSNDDKSNRLSVGAAVKAGQVLGLIGDLSGISVEIDVPEVDIDKIKPGMAAIIRSVAYPRDELKGKLVAVNAQASAANNSSLPSFTAIVEVKNLTPEQQAWVKVGMSAAIEIHVESSNKITVPIAAIHHIKGKNIVQVEEKGGVKPRVVITGAAQADKVVIDSGLSSGEKVLVNLG
jgi:HlyD family secretion protein